MTELIAGKKRIVAWVTAAAVLAVLILSLTFVLSHLDHDCTGEDCSICAEIRVCTAAIHLIAGAVGIGTVIIFAYIIIQKPLTADSAGRKLCPVSLVSLKIRLDD